MTKKVLFISTRTNAPTYSDRQVILDTLADSVRSEEVTVDTTMFEQLEFAIYNNVTSIWDSKNSIDLATYDLIYVKNWKAHQGAASALAVYAADKNVTCICSELHNFRAMDKIAESFLLSTNGIPYADTLYAVDGSQLLSALARRSSEFTLPLIVKAIDGSAGEDNYLAQDLSEVKHIINDNVELSFMVQNFIPNDGDHRIIVLGYEPKLAFKRSRASDDTHLNNTSQGATAAQTTIQSYSQQVLDDAVSAARLVAREIAGVDVLYDERTGAHIILEVNASPQLATGALLQEKSRLFSDYITGVLKSR
jgi:glutathione synthase/RimK-type ligase-like ATP-grasp enzyme